jgi:protein-disulfide isomerase
MLCLGLVLSGSVYVATTRAGAASASASHSEVDALKTELAHVKAGLEHTQQALESLRQMVAQRPAPPSQQAETPVTVRLAGNPSLGAAEAPLTLVEFSDYQCPFCRRFVETTLPELKRDYIDTGKLRYVFRDFPLDQLHPQARKAAEAARCAGEQGKFWEMHDLLFRNQKALQLEALTGYARQLGLQAPAFEACLAQGKYAPAIQQDLTAGTAAGVHGTPGFVLGTPQPDGTIQGIALRGAQPIAAFRQAIARVLGEP